MMTVTVEERQKIDEIINSNTLCYVGMVDTEGLPYVIPMNFGYAGDIIYMHSAPEGKSIESLEKNPNVCITFCSKNELVYQNEEVACSYGIKGSSVICRGKVVFVKDDLQEKERILNIFMKQYSDRAFTYSEPALRNVLVWKVEIESVTTRLFGVRHPNSRHYKEGESYY